MSKKIILNDDELGYDNTNETIIDDYINNDDVSDEDFDNIDDNIDDDMSIITDDDDDIDIIIEIDDDDLIIESDVKNDETDSDVILSKHKIEGKHSLKYDSIFKGKKDDILDEDIDSCISDIYYKDTIEVDVTSQYYYESIDNEKYIRAKDIKEKVYLVLDTMTEINFLKYRRKSSRVDFNQYYNILKNSEECSNFSNIELFNELAVYFSDNLFNMFKLLDKKWRNIIIIELQEHIGKNNNSKEITNRNIYEGTEVEFKWTDEYTDSVTLITGDVIEVDYPNSTFMINSYERIYEVHIDIITKILNNNKFKYNLNKLDNIDFL